MQFLVRNKLLKYGLIKRMLEKAVCRWDKVFSLKRKASFDFRQDGLYSEGGLIV